MNRSIAAALLRDAYAQVVDNLVFRLLVWILILMVLPTFLVQLGPQGIRFLFTLEYRWDQIFGAFGGLTPSSAALEDMHVTAIEWIQGGVANHLAGKIGVLLCVAATAFFVPRMLEKGAADTLFSKPVSRLVLLLSRYVAGLIFVSVLAFGLIGGMHLGFSLVSGHSMEGFLWSIPMLIYLFAVMHAFSMLAGVVTRSSVAAILSTVVFFFANACVHNGWEFKQMVTDADLLADLGGEAEVDIEVQPAFLRWAGKALDAAHFVLPKTGDAPRLVGLMRTRAAADPEEFRDAESRLVVAAAPEGFRREARGTLAREGVLWLAPEPGGGESRITLQRREAHEFENRQAEARALQAELEGRSDVTDVTAPRGALAGRSSHGVRWLETRAGQTRQHQRWFFEGGGWLFVLHVDASAESDLEQRLQRFTAGISFEDERLESTDFNPWKVYTERFGWTAPPAYNAWLSIATTLAFALGALLLAWWRLSRIDF